MELSIISVLSRHVLVKAKFFRKTLARQTKIKPNVSMKKVNELLYVFVKGFMLLLKKRSYYYYELGQGDFYLFNQEKALFLLIYLLPTQKEIVTTKKSCLPRSRVYHLSQSGPL